MTYPGVALKFVQAYGFQHIQNIIRKLKTNKCDYEYVELMACPSGCLNGGGQIKAIGDMAQHLDNISALNNDKSIRKVGVTRIETLIQTICDLHPDWMTCTFHQIDQNDPMLQAA